MLNLSNSLTGNYIKYKLVLKSIVKLACPNRTIIHAVIVSQFTMMTVTWYHSMSNVWNLVSCFCNSAAWGGFIMESPVLYFHLILSGGKISSGNDFLMFSDIYVHFIFEFFGIFCIGFLLLDRNGGGGG